MPEFRRIPVTNIHPRPNPRSSTANPTAWFSSSEAVGASSEVVAADGRNGIRLTRLSTAGLALYNSRASAGLWPIANLKLGDQWTILINIRSSINANIQSNLGTGTVTTLSAFNQTFPTLAGVLTECRRTFTVTQALIDQGLPVFLKWTLSTLTVGLWVEFSSCMVVPGVYNGPFLDGDSPDWRWFGTANASQSAGPLALV